MTKRIDKEEIALKHIKTLNGATLKNSAAHGLSLIHISRFSEVYFLGFHAKSLSHDPQGLTQVVGADQNGNCLLYTSCTGKSKAKEAQ